MTQYKASYDHQSKQLISHKIFLAKILSQCIDELIDRSDEEIIRCIESYPMIGNVSINTGELIEGRANDFSLFNEGENTFDIFFNIYIPFREMIEKRMINIEIQNNFYPGYSIESRAEFYAARMLSMQYGREISRMDYHKLKKVHTIWINTNPPKYLVNTIYQKQMTPKFVHGENKKIKESQLLNMAMMNLGKPDECTGVLRMLAVILSDELSAKTKIEILDREYAIQLNKKIGKELEDMCDLANAIENRGIEKGKASVLLTLFKEKLGYLTKETINSINAASYENLERLTMNFMNIKNEDDIQDILINP